MTSSADTAGRVQCDRRVRLFLFVLFVTRNNISRITCEAFTFLPPRPVAVGCFSTKRSHIHARDLLAQKSKYRVGHIFLLPSKGSGTGSDDDKGDDEGVDLAAQFFKTLKERGDIKVNIDDYDDDDEDEDEDEKDEEEDGEQRMPSDRGGKSEEDEDEIGDIPISKVNLFSGRDEGGVGKLAGNVTLTNRELYEGLKERVLESPRAFANLVGDEDAADDVSEKGPYKPPDLTPDSGLTAGEVVTLVLDALLHNDEPRPNYGVEVLFAYSSPASVLKSDRAPTVEEYADFIKTSEYSPMLNHTQVIIDKADYSLDGKRAFYTVRLRTGKERAFTSINFILSTGGKDDDDCWLIDSNIIRSEGVGRGRRRR